MATISRRRFLEALGACATLSAMAPTKVGGPPNLVVIVADDLGDGDVGAYGHPHIRTPHMDALAKESIRFTNAFLTTSSCSPSRASTLTGMYAHSTGAGELHLPIPKERALLTTPLRERGYWTAAAGKWHLGEAVREQFDHVVGGGPSGTELWVETVGKCPPGRPFFLWLAATDPHRPYAPDTLAWPHTPAETRVPPFLPDTPEVRADLAAYYDEVTRFDAGVGQVMAALGERDLLGNTLVVVFSDNGRPFPRCKTTLYDSGIRTPFIVRLPGAHRGGTSSRALLSVVDLAPTLLELAGAAPLPEAQGRSFAANLNDVDAPHRKYVYAEHNWHDYSARERAVRSADYLYIRNDYHDLPRTPPADAVRSPTFRAMQTLQRAGELPESQAGPFLVPAPREELYDVREDPHQMTNLAGLPEYQATLAHFRTRMNAWQEETADAAPPVRRPDGFDRETGERLE